MIEKALIKGQIARAIYEDGHKLFMIHTKDKDKVSECTPYEKSLFFNSDAEIRILENVTLEELKGKLLKEKAFFDALNGAIGGMDFDLSENTRILSMQRAESLVENHETYDFVISRLFGNPLPEEADLGEAIVLSIEKDCPTMNFIYTNLLNGKDIIDRIDHIFKKAIFELELHSEYLKIKNLFISTGLFAQLFLGTIEKNLEKLKRLVPDYKDNSELQENAAALSILSRIISLLEQEYDFQKNGSEVEPEEIEPVNYIIRKKSNWAVKDKEEPYNKKAPRDPGKKRNSNVKIKEKKIEKKEKDQSRS